MIELTLKARTRSVHGKKVKSLRMGGILPAVLYGHGVASRSLALKGNEFLKVYREAGESTLVDLVIDEQSPVKVIVQEVQLHPVTGQPLHVDFHQVQMTEKVHTEIPLVFTREAPAVKELGGVLVKNLDRLKVEALPGDLVPEIAVDIASLATFEDVLQVKDLSLPPGIVVLDKPEEVVALVTPPRSEEELKSLETTAIDEKAAVEAVEGVKEKPEEAQAPLEAAKEKQTS